MSRVLLIKPRFLSPGIQVIAHPMGLMYIASVLKKSGHEMKIHDCAADDRHLDLLKRTIKEWQPDFIGLSIIITELEQTKVIMSMIREMMPDVPVTFGGPWPSANPEASIRTFGADFVVIGEGEPVFPELIEAIEKRLPVDSIPGTASMVNGHLKINSGHYLTESELNALPFPAWELLDHNLYAKKMSHAAVGRRKYMTIITSRGCPFKCAYCHQTMGKFFRKRTAESVLKEMETLRLKYGFREFEIVDDCFNLDRERTRAILTGIKDRIGDARLHFPNGLRADVLEPEDMVLFKQAGTVSAIFAIETSSQRLQKMIHKNLDIEKASRVINASVKAGIYTSGFFMVGFPTETYEEGSATVEFALSSSLHRAFFCIPTPFEGTELADMAREVIQRKHYTIDPLRMTYFNRDLNISAMSDRDLQKNFRRAYIRFYLNPKRILQIIIHHPNILSLPFYAVVTLLKILPKRPRWLGL